jgi:hypothetical protein
MERDERPIIIIIIINIIIIIIKGKGGQLVGALSQP